MRNDPADNGGLFIGRRPGTAPIRFRSLPQRGSYRRQRIDDSIALILLTVIVLISLLCWGPLPLACLWIGSQANYLSGSVGLGIVVEFAGLLALLLGALMVLTRLDHAWILVRRAANHDQRTGVLGRVFATVAAIAAAIFTVWFLVINGPGMMPVELVL